MSNRQPKIGETLLYCLNADDVVQIREAIGGHRGNHHEECQLVPFIAVRLWPGEYGTGSAHGVNGQLILDGNATLWRTSVCFAPGPGGYRFQE